MNGLCLLSQLTPHDSNLPLTTTTQPVQRRGRFSCFLGSGFWNRFLKEEKKKEAAASEIKDKHWCPQLEILIATEEEERQR